MPTAPQKKKARAPRNRTIELSDDEAARLRPLLVLPQGDAPIAAHNTVICGDTFGVLPRLEPRVYKLLFADPPYNLSKDFGTESFRRLSNEAYEQWLDSWLSLCVPLLAPDASIYLCGDWRSGAAIQRVGSKYFTLRNRLTWEREKGRGSSRNWKSSSEDIWFFTVCDDFTFNIDAVKLRRKVLAPYRQNGSPKDWEPSESGNFRDTHPSNLWTDISVPFWSMPENTDHPTQKPEKLLAKLILASSNTGDLILDPFAGSGTTAVAAAKLGRHFTAIEADEEYCLLTLKRLEMAKTDTSIQGFSDGVFWERNSSPARER